MLKELTSQANATTISLMSNERVIKTMRIVTTTLTVLSMFLMVAFGAPTTTGAAGNVETGIKNGLGDIYKLLSAIVLPIAAICLAIAAFEFFLAGERGAEKAKKILLYTIVGMALVYLAPVLVNAVSGWFKSSSDATGVFS